MNRSVELGFGMPPVCRLGLATRGNTHLQTEDVLLAWERGINYWNWCGSEDGMSRAVRELGPDRSKVAVAAQIEVDDWSEDTMERELDNRLEQLQTGWLDVVTLYYVESQAEWSTITADEGAINALQNAKADGRLRAIGLTTHQRHLAALWMKTGLLDLLMIRYNAAHRGAETEIFPIAAELDLSVVCFTGLRWGALLETTKDDPPEFEIPPAREWYRFVLSHPSVSVALMAPDDRRELMENLTLLDDWRALSPERREEMKQHGDRVRNTAGPFL
jgi:predicted aldo/keto reductase-like oxidoreductase